MDVAKSCSFTWIPPEFRKPKFMLLYYSESDKDYSIRFLQDTVLNNTIRKVIQSKSIKELIKRRYSLKSRPVLKKSTYNIKIIKGGAMVRMLTKNGNYQGAREPSIYLLKRITKSKKDSIPLKGGENAIMEYTITSEQISNKEARDAIEDDIVKIISQHNLSITEVQGLFNNIMHRLTAYMPVSTEWIKN